MGLDASRKVVIPSGPPCVQRPVPVQCNAVPKSAPLKTYRESTREELLDIIRSLEADALAREAEMDALEDALAVPRSCTDPRCCLCAACVDAIFRKAHPLPLTIPRKYVVSAWRKP